MNILDFAGEIKVFKHGQLVKTFFCPNLLTFPYLKMILLDKNKSFTIEFTFQGKTVTLHPMS